ncbi:VOC family protein [Microbulbifer litoralis]|uniref:VOC family protein n=1 Tax=Microbulbifer litoralis TaxID=2933965 RepID=UPI002028CC8A|nr:VOC family protein [Microbulbifer sp. GX H0434]
MFVVFVPTENVERAEKFYGEVMGFKEDLWGFQPPGSEASDVRINPRRVDDHCGLNFSLFRYEVESNFLSYCEVLISKGVKFKVAGMTPGGYTAIAKDFDGNQFEIECQNFDEDDDSISPEEWTFYKRY